VENVAWTRSLFEAMSPFLETGVSMNNLGDEGRGRVKDAYGANYDRLATVKAAYDPDNLFRFNPDIAARHHERRASPGDGTTATTPGRVPPRPHLLTRPAASRRLDRGTSGFAPQASGSIRSGEATAEYGAPPSLGSGGFRTDQSRSTSIRALVLPKHGLG
jgi:hypothetical protein